MRYAYAEADWETLSPCGRGWSEQALACEGPGEGFLRQVHTPHPARCLLRSQLATLSHKGRGEARTWLTLACEPTRERNHVRYGFKMRSASAWPSPSACAGVLFTASAACSPSLSALVTRWFSWVDNSATAYCSWSRATAAAANPPT